MEYGSLKDISRHSSSSKIVVRVARMWEFRDQQTGTILYELDFVIIDKEGIMMEGYVPNNRIDQFKGMLKEGSVYSFQYFMLPDAKRSYKAVDNRYRLRVTQRTKIQEIIPPPINFPMFAYKSEPFSILSTRSNNNDLLSDVVGLVTAVTEVSISPATQQNKRQIFITDGSDRAVITLWGNHADSFDALSLQERSAEEPIIILFVGMTVGEFSGMLAFKSTSVTRWYINIPTSEIAAVQLATKDHDHHIEWQGPARARSEPSDITLTALLADSPYDRIGERFRFKILITDLVSLDNWWYISCKRCWKKLITDEGIFKCPRCGITTPQPRYKLVFVGIDAYSENNEVPPTAHFTFLGREGVSIIGKDESLLVPDATLSVQHAPPDILVPIGKRYVLVVELTDGSWDADDLCFQVNTLEEIQDYHQELESQLPESSVGTENPSSSNYVEPNISKDNSQHTPPRDVLEVSALDKTKNIVSKTRKRAETSTPQTISKRGQKANAARQLYTDE